MLTAKISGFIRDILILRYMGTTPASQAFTFASQIPRDFLDAAFAAAISASFIPVFNSHLEKKSKEEAFGLACNFITLVIILAAFFTIVGFLAAGPLASFYLASEGGPETAALGGRLLRILIFTIFTTATAFALTGVLQSLGEFNIPAVMSLVPNVLILAFLLLFFDDMGVYGLASAFLIGAMLQILIFIPPLRKRGFKFRFRLNLRDKAMVSILRLSPPVLVSAWLFPINNLVNSWVVSNFSSAEALVELRAANTIYLVITGFFVLSVTNVLFPKLSREAAKESSEGKSQFAPILQASLSGVTFLLIPMAVGLWILREPIVRLPLQGGEFTAESAGNTAYALGLSTIGMLGFGLTTILSRAFFSVMNGKIPMIASLTAIVVNFAVALALVGHFGIGAAALSGALSITFAGAVMLFVMSRKFTIFSGEFLINVLKMAVSAVVMGAALMFLKSQISNLHDILIIGIISLSGIVIYGISNLMFNTKEAEIAKTLVLARFRKDNRQ